MAAENYSPPEKALIKATRADFDRRDVVQPVHLVQYDNTLPVLAVALYKGGQPWTLPTGADVNLRMDKKDGHYVYNPALGVSSDRSTVYMAVTAQMTTSYGTFAPVVEVLAGGGVAGMAALRLDIDRNPLPENAIISSDEYKTLEQLVADVKASAQAAANSAAAAKTSENAAANSAAAAGNTANRIKDSMTQISENKEAVSQLKDDLAHYSKRGTFDIVGWVSQSGEFTDTGGSFSTDFIEIEGTFLSYKLAYFENMSSISFWDENKKFISYVGGSTTTIVESTVNIPDNAKYYRATYFKELISDPYVIMHSSTGDIRKNAEDIRKNAEDIKKKLSINEDISNFSIKGYIDTTGKVVTNSNSNVTDFINCLNYNFIHFRLAEINGGLMLAFYDADKNFISGISGIKSNLEMVEYTTEVPSNAMYLRGGMWSVSGETYYIEGIYSLNDINTKLRNHDIRISEIESNTSVLRYKYGDSIKKPFDFDGKTAISFGDSITAGVANEGSGNISVGTNSYINTFSRYVGLSLTNRAVSGSTITYANNETLESIYTRIMAMTETPDVIIISGGTNDYNTGKELGNFGDTDSTNFYGALYQICEKLKTYNSNATVIFITPINITKDFNGHDRNLLNNYRNAIYEVATSYGFNVVNGVDLVPVTKQTGWDDTMINHVDGCHPTVKGHQLYARNLAMKLC